MKSKLLIVLLAASGILFACNSNETSNGVSIEQIEADINAPEIDPNLDPKIEMRKQDNLKLLKYLRLENNRFVLDISEEDALKLGVSKESYIKACEDIARENANIEKMEKTGQKHEITDPQKVYKELVASGEISE